MLSSLLNTAVLACAVQRVAGTASSSAPAQSYVHSTTNNHSTASVQNTTYNNPILPGFHPDPSCIFVPELDNTFFCASSSFLAFPSIPIHASKDLLNWRLISHAISRPSQWSEFGNTTLQLGGMFAPTIRYNDGRFYVIAAYAAIEQLALFSFTFNTTDPFAPDAWGNPVFFNGVGIDPDLYFDSNGTTYVSSTNSAPSGITQSTIDVATGALGGFDPYNIWNGTGAASPEGPHIYFKDDYYYLAIAEGGTELQHRQTIARSQTPSGPFESYSENPILTNANTTQYFQTVGHADFFQDSCGNWWGVALATRCGPEYENFPMGRETVLYPVTWEDGEWPVLDQVRGTMEGPLPPRNLNISGLGAFIDAPDNVDFVPGSSIPLHFTYWRYPKADAYTVSPPGHENTLRLKPSNLNLTASVGYNPLDGQTFISRRQVDSLFTYSVDVDFSPVSEGEETGVSAFLKQEQHLDLGIVRLRSNGSTGELANYLRFKAINNTLYISPSLIESFSQTGGEGLSELGGLLGKRDDAADNSTVLVPIPSSWDSGKIRLQIQAKNATDFTFSAASVPSCGNEIVLECSEEIVLGTASAALVSGGFTGLLLGAYATTNGGGDNGTEAYISRWRYSGQGQVLY